MREILFRGKHLLRDANDKEAWVYGRLLYHANENPELAQIATDGVDENGLRSLYVVDASTVGQYTGLRDRNGNKVFEGDILKIYQKSDALGTYFYPEVPYPCNVIVKWDFCAWMWETITKDKRYISFPDAWCHYSCEVIGNIYDNPELLEEGK